ncbi:type II secretion system protein [Candidatus Daviesbacteria bacterium]|nr:type II secretion system protein [Candidatus Daviesbacteria bacterium]
MKKTNKGFALIEALIAVLIIGVIGFILTDLLLRTFKGSDKTRLISKVVQNGQVALNNITQALRDADVLVCWTPGKIVILTKGQASRYSFAPPGPGVNGYIFKNSINSIKAPTALQDYCTDSEGDFTDYFTFSAPVKLTDDSPAGVSVQNGSFSSIPQSGQNKDAITIQFQVGPSVSAGSGFENQLGGSGVIDFKTTVQLK